MSPQRRCKDTDKFIVSYTNRKPIMVKKKILLCSKSVLAVIGFRGRRQSGYSVFRLLTGFSRVAFRLMSHTEPIDRAATVRYADIGTHHGKELS